KDAIQAAQLLDICFHGTYRISDHALCKITVLLHAHLQIVGNYGCIAARITHCKYIIFRKEETLKRGASWCRPLDINHADSGRQKCGGPSDKQRHKACAV